MARYIDVRKAGGDLVILGDSLVVPVSDVDSVPNPFDGAIRYNPTLETLQVYYNAAWNILNGYLTGGSSFLSLSDTPDAYTGKANHTVKINSAANAVEFVAPGQILVTTDATTAKNLVLTDAGRHIRFTSGIAVTVTVPENATIAFPIGTTISLVQAGAGQVSVVGAGSVTIDALTGYNPATAAQNSIIQLVKHSTDGWIIFGALAATV